MARFDWLTRYCRWIDLLPAADLPVIEAMAYMNAAALFLLLQTIMTLRRTK